MIFPCKVLKIVQYRFFSKFNNLFKILNNNLLVKSVNFVTPSVQPNPFLLWASMSLKFLTKMENLSDSSAMDS